MFGSCREAIPNVREWTGGPLGCPGVVGIPSLIFGSGREALPDIREFPGVPPGCPDVVGRPS